MQFGMQRCTLSTRSNRGDVCNPLLDNPDCINPLRTPTWCALAAALYPIDTIKTRLQLVRTGGGIRALIQGGGGKALYAGIWGNLLGVAPSTGVFMAIYEPLKQVGLRIRGFYPVCRGFWLVNPQTLVAP